ncbi:CBASS oligonucleotide cyclase [Candidatus Poriferisocius sp.]|uniref:CBASS oligonucleotide cyclase n=1 Tax=Candidatus Poriferisocius sp. TaxID=3101276 RepID=UPI003B014971
MTYVDDAFEKMRQAGEITKGEQALAQKRHHRIREVLSGEWDIEKTFLTGSYDRHTKIKPLEDVDIFAVIDPAGGQGHYRQKLPNSIITALVNCLQGKFNRVEADGMAVRITMSDNDGDASFELVPAFEHSQAGYEAPDPQRGRWIRTDPEAHAQLTSSKNAACRKMWVPFVKMVKGWNLQVGRPVPQSFLIETMALTLVHPPFGRYQDEITTFFGNVIDHASGPWADPAGIGPDVDELLTSSDRDSIRCAAKDALSIAEEAVYLEDEGEERNAVELWREIFGPRMPRP